jgi:hypothetical protein
MFAHRPGSGIALSATPADFPLGFLTGRRRLRQRGRCAGTDAPKCRLSRHFGAARGRTGAGRFPAYSTASAHGPWFSTWPRTRGSGPIWHWRIVAGHKGACTLEPAHSHPARWPRSVHAPTCRLPVIHFKPLPEMLQIARRSIGQMRIIGEQLSARMTQHARAAQRGNRASRCQQAGIFSRSRQMPVTAIGAALGKRTCTPQRLIGRLGSFKGLVQLFTDHCVRTGPWQVSPKLVSNKISIV